MQRSLLKDAIAKLSSNIDRSTAALDGTNREIGYRQDEVAYLEDDLICRDPCAPGDASLTSPVVWRVGQEQREGRPRLAGSPTGGHGLANACGDCAR